MRRINYCLLLCLMCVSAMKCVAQNAGSLSVGLSPGYRNDLLTWSIAGTLDGTDPNIYSELQWTGLQSVGLNFDGNYQLTNRIILKAAALKARIVAGKVSDYDYQEDNRQYESFAGLFDADKGSMVDINAAIGYQLIKKESIILNLYAGYGLSRQNLFLRDNKGVYNAQLNSTYDTKWQGALASAEAVFNLTGRFYLAPSFTYHQLKYNAKGNWNMIPDFEHPVSYRHNANGFAVVPALRIGYQFNNRLQFNINANYHYYETGKGIDMLYLTNGQRPKTQLNGVNFQGYMLSAGINYRIINK